MSDLNASVGVDFSLLGTNLHAAYEKKGKEGYAVLLLPTEQKADQGVSIKKVIEDIKSLVSGVYSQQEAGGADVSIQQRTENMEQDLMDGVNSLDLGEGGEKDGDTGLENLRVKLQMAYLYIRKVPNQESQLEYAFQLQVIASNVIPKEIQSLVDVDNVSISVWNTSRQKVVERMSLVTIDEYIGIAEKPQAEAGAGAEQ